MSALRLYAVTDTGGRPLPAPPAVQTFTDLYDEKMVGVYSALRTFAHHKFLSLDVHLDRTEKSMALLGWSYTLDRTRLCRVIDQICLTLPWENARVRFDVLPRAAPALGTESRELVAVQPFTPPPERLYEEGVVAALADGLARAHPRAKTSDFPHRRAVYLQQMGTAAYELLLVDDHGRILEGTRTNFFAVRDGVLYTAGEGVLEGVTRAVILRLAGELGLPVRLEAVRVEEIDTLQEAAISGSSRDLLPVVQIGEQEVGNGRPGPITLRLLAAYRQYVEQAVKPATEFA